MSWYTKKNPSAAETSRKNSAAAKKNRNTPWRRSPMVLSDANVARHKAFTGEEQP